jgi:hypothetical protein
MILFSPRPLYTLSFRLPRQTLWDIPQPLLPLSRCSLFACHLSAARSSCSAQPRGIDTPRGDGSKGLARASTPGLEAMSLPCNFLFRPVSDSGTPSSCGTSFRISSPPSQKLLPMEVRSIDLRKAVFV